MNNSFKTPDFSGFGVISNSIHNVPEAFIIKNIAAQNTQINNNIYNYNPYSNIGGYTPNSYDESCYDYEDSLWYDEDYWDDKNYNDYEEGCEY